MSLTSRLKSGAELLFPERQVLLRTDGQIRFVTLRRPFQIALTAAATALVSWTIYATVGLGVSEQTVARRDARIAAISNAYDRLSSDLRSVHARYEAITRALESKHLFLNDVLKDRAGLERRLETLSGQLEQAQSQRDRARATGDDLQSEVVVLSDQLDDALATADRLEQNLDRMGTELRDTASARDAAARRSEDLGRTLSDLRSRLSDSAGTQADLKRSLDSSGRTADALRIERDQERARNARLNHRVTELEKHLAFLEASQSSLIARLNDQTQTNITSLESAVGLTGLDVNRLIARIGGRSAIGGPLIEFAGVGADGGLVDERDELGRNSLTGLERRLERWAALNEILQILPIAAPLDSYRITSGFGSRRDPFTKRRAFHAGLDLAGPLRSPIYSTAPGVVTFVGWNGPYGRTVIIDHGHGLETKFGHLKKILVKKGQRVGFRTKIGLMGSSGRSTGTHVHYEIVFDNKPMDPRQFLKAGKYVFKQG